MCVNNTCADSVTYITGKLKQVTNFQLYEDTVRMGPLEGPTALGAFFNMTNRPHVSAHPRRSSPRASLLASQPAGLQDGIIGLGFTSRSVANAPNLVLSFAASGAIGASQFSMSLNATGGALTLGGLGPFITSPIEWTPVVKEGFWQVGVKEVRQKALRLCVVVCVWALTDGAWCRSRWAAHVSNLCPLPTRSPFWTREHPRLTCRTFRSRPSWGRC